MDKIKQITEKLLPPEQKVLNIFKIAYLVLLIISLPEIFVYVGGEAVLGIWNALAWFALWAVFIVSMLALPMYYKSKKRNLVFIPLLIFLIFLYIIAVKSHRYTAGLLDVLYFLPVLVTFILWNKKTANPTRNLIIFLAVPFSLIAFDKIVTLGFQLSCPFIIPETEYNPIYLPKRFFHEEDGKLVPNIQEIKELQVYANYRVPDINNTIFLYDFCGWTDKNVTQKLIEQRNIVLCIQTESDINERKDRHNKFNLNISTLSIFQLNADSSKTLIAKLYSRVFVKNYEELWLREPSRDYCGFFHNFSCYDGKFNINRLKNYRYIKRLDKEEP